MGLNLFSKLRDRRCSRLVSFSVFWLPSIKYENEIPKAPGLGANVFQFVS